MSSPTFSVSVSKLAEPMSDIKCVLDAPVSGQLIDTESLGKNGMLLSGWMAAKAESLPKPFFECNGQTHYLDLNVYRPDVLSMLAQHFKEFSSQGNVGFYVTVPMLSSEGVLGIECPHGKHYLYRINIVNQLKILQGKQGWLYLDNDTNNSVGQYRGQVRLGLRGYLSWIAFFRDLKKLVTKKSLPYSMLIAPAKEMVISEFYPFEKGKLTLVEQVENIARVLSINFDHPRQILRFNEKSSFRKCDSHWTHSGSQKAWLVALSKLGLSVRTAMDFFSTDTYRVAEISGDLGAKLYPVQKAKEFLLNGVNFQDWVVYDNQLPNFGRVIVTANYGALHNKRVLIFGSSSSYTMLNYVGRSFAEVVFVHSASNVDVAFLELTQADYLVLQSNGRFLIKPPTVKYNIVEDVTAKWNSMATDDKEKASKKISKYLQGEAPNWVVKIHTFTMQSVNLEG